MRNPTLTIPATLHADHAAMLREHHFETAGVMRDLLRSDEYDGIRAIYAVTNPEQTMPIRLPHPASARRNLRTPGDVSRVTLVPSA